MLIPPPMPLPIPTGNAFWPTFMDCGIIAANAVRRSQHAPARRADGCLVYKLLRRG